MKKLPLSIITMFSLIAAIIYHGDVEARTFSSFFSRQSTVGENSDPVSPVSLSVGACSQAIQAFISAENSYASKYATCKTAQALTAKSAALKNITELPEESENFPPATCNQCFDQYFIPDVTNMYLGVQEEAVSQNVACAIAPRLKEHVQKYYRVSRKICSACGKWPESLENRLQTTDNSLPAVWALPFIVTCADPNVNPALGPLPTGLRN